jgi:hypothetical protein
VFYRVDPFSGLILEILSNSSFKYLKSGFVTFKIKTVVGTLGMKDKARIKFF